MLKNIKYKKSNIMFIIKDANIQKKKGQLFTLT